MMDATMESRYREGATPEQLAAEFHCDTSAILLHLRLAGVLIRNEEEKAAVARYRRPVLPGRDEVNEIVKLYEEGFSLRAVGLRVHRRKEAIRRILTEAGVEIRVFGVGPKVEVTVTELARLYLIEKKSCTAIGAQIGVSPTWVSRQLAEVGIKIRQGRPPSPSS